MKGKSTLEVYIQLAPFKQDQRGEGGEQEKKETQWSANKYKQHSFANP